MDSITLTDTQQVNIPMITILVDEHSIKKYTWCKSLLSDKTLYIHKLVKKSSIGLNEQDTDRSF